MVLATIRQLEARESFLVLQKLSEKIRRRHEVPREPTHFYVTELLYCPLQSYLYRVEPASPPLEAALLQEIGRHVHDLVEAAAKELGYQVEVHVEQKCEDVTITGRADIVTGDSVIEVKTVADIPSYPYEQHVLQAWFYAEALGKRAQILYISRSNGEVAAYPLEPPAEGATATLCRRAMLLREALEKKEPPGCIPGPWCAGCPYRYRCPCW